MIDKKEEYDLEYVYKIEVDDVVRYIGRTNNLKRRQYEHKRFFLLGKKKELYDKIKDIGRNESVLNLEVIKEFRKRTDAKRYECLLILEDFFGKKELWQKVPRIAD